MPPRTSRTPKSSLDHSYYRRAVPHHASVITILWVVLLFFSLGFAMILLIQSARIAILQRYLDSVVRQQIIETQSLRSLSVDIDSLNRTCVKIPSASAPTVLGAPTTAQGETLTRGAYSPDGIKIAGYDDVTSGKKGIGVRVVGETRIRHVVIFNAKTESSGAGTSYESSMSVRWKDNSTIEYDVLVKKADGTQSVEARSVQIYF